MLWGGKGVGYHCRELVGPLRLSCDGWRCRGVGGEELAERVSPHLAKGLSRYCRPWRAKWGQTLCVVFSGAGWAGKIGVPIL